MTDDISAVIPFIDLAAQRRRLGTSIDDAIARVLEHGRFIMGPEVAELESELATFAGVDHCISCASGTDALLMALLAWGVGPGDGVLVPTFTFASTAEVVALVGAVPVFVDVSEDTFNIDRTSMKQALEQTARAGLRAAAVIPVDLFGQPADYGAVRDVADEAGLLVLADAAQSFGALLHGRSPVALGHVGATSFFPAKPLGCYGDGGALFTNDEEVAATLRSIRVHGQGSNKYDNVRIGINGRLDTLQAAILIQKLTIFEEELKARNEVAARYEEALSDVVRTPGVPRDRTSAWAQYTILCSDRDRVAEELRRRGIPTAIYYPQTLHRQPPYAGFPVASHGVPVAESLTHRVLSLPMHPYLEPSIQDLVICAVREAVIAASA